MTKTIRARALAPAKLNLHLRVTGRRQDGYHLLESIVVPIDVFDRLVLELRPDVPTGLELHCAPEGLLPDDARNLVWRAADLYLCRAPMSGHLRIQLDKIIPAGAGLGGGSSDAGATLRALDAMAARPVGADRLQQWALELGADVPFFVLGRPARVRGIGEVVEPLTSWPRLLFVVAYAGLPLATADVYRAHAQAALTNEPVASMNLPLAADRLPPEVLLSNDLEAAATRILPRLTVLKKRILELGARGALMTGSGSAVFGTFERWSEAESAVRALGEEGFWAGAARILNRAPEVEVEWSSED